MSNLKKPWARTRNRNYTAAFTGLYENKAVYLPSGTIAFDQKTDRILNVQQIDTMSDTVTPGFAQRVANGEIISNPSSMESRVYQCSDTGIHLRQLTSGVDQNYKESRVTPFYFGVVNHLTTKVNMDNLKTLAQTKCLAGIKASSMMGIVALAESGKTLRMVLEPLKTIIPALAYIRQLRKGNVNIAIARKQGRKLLINGRDFGKPRYWYNGPGKLVKPPKGTFVIPAGDTVSASVLAYNLGLKPLMMDLEAFLKDIPKAHETERQTYRSSVDDWDEQKDVKSYGTTYFTASGTTKTKTSVNIRCSALVQDRFDVLSDFGMSVHDIPEAGWELIPFSFVLDYFVNVGDVLGAARALRQEKILAFSTVTTVTKETTRSFGNCALVPGNPFNQMVRAFSGTEVLTGITKTRDVELPSLGFAYVPRPFRPVVQQNLLSLLVQELKRHKSPNVRTFY